MPTCLVLWVVASVLACTGCATEPDEKPLECATCSYDNNPYGEFFSPPSGYLLQHTVDELDGYVYTSTGGGMWFASFDGRTLIDFTKLVRDKYQLRQAFLSSGVYDAQRNSFWIGVYGRYPDSATSRTDTTLVLEYELETAAFTEHSTMHIWPDGYDSQHENRAGISDVFFYEGEVRMYSNTPDLLVFRNDRLERVTDDIFRMGEQRGQLITSNSSGTFVLWRHVITPGETTYHFNGKVIAIPSLDGFNYAVHDYNVPTRTFLVSVIIDSCAYRVHAYDTYFRSPRIDFCSITSETADTITLSPIRSLGLTELDCTLLSGQGALRFVEDTTSIMFSAYNWGDPYFRLHRRTNDVLNPL